MQHTIRYFAWVAELVGTDSEERVLDPGCSLSDLIDLLTAEGGGYSAAFADRARIRFAIDGEMAAEDAIIGNAAEIAIFPPVTGG